MREKQKKKTHSKGDFKKHLVEMYICSTLAHNLNNIFQLVADSMFPLTLFANHIHKVWHHSNCMPELTSIKYCILCNIRGRGRGLGSQHHSVEHSVACYLSLDWRKVKSFSLKSHLLNCLYILHQFKKIIFAVRVS